ncbi:MAG TPA: hypothetical protein VEL76_12740 [Gemmataceae bacterium]|nr:hypothetical protein [Gemmataceae bacterium]
MSRIAGMIIGAILCGLIPAIGIGAALGNRQTQIALGLPGAAHGFGNVFPTLAVLVLGGTLGGMLGWKWGARARHGMGPDAELPHAAGRATQPENADPQSAKPSARAAIDDQQVCYLCGRLPKGKELESRVCSACQL